MDTCGDRRERGGAPRWQQQEDSGRRDEDDQLWGEVGPFYLFFVFLISCGYINRAHAHCCPGGGGSYSWFPYIFLSFTEFSFLLYC